MLDNAPSDTNLSRISQLVYKLQLAEKEVIIRERELQKAKEYMKEIQEIDLPSALHEHGVSELKLTDGSKVSITSYTTASIPKDRQDEAFEWLRDKGHGDLVKNVVTVTFGRQEDEHAAQLANALSQRGLNTAQKQWVEPMTLKAFAKESDEKGTPLPDELFGVFRGFRAKITRK